MNKWPNSCASSLRYAVWPETVLLIFFVYLYLFLLSRFTFFLSFFALFRRLSCNTNYFRTCRSICKQLLDEPYTMQVWTQMKPNDEESEEEEKKNAYTHVVCVAMKKNHVRCVYPSRRSDEKWINERVLAALSERCCFTLLRGRNQVCLAAAALLFVLHSTHWDCVYIVNGSQCGRHNGVCTTIIECVIV